MYKSTYSKLYIFLKILEISLQYSSVFAMMIEIYKIHCLHKLRDNQKGPLL